MFAGVFRVISRLVCVCAIATLGGGRASAQVCGVQPGFEPGLIPSISGGAPSFSTAMLALDDGSGPALYTVGIGTPASQSTLPATSVSRLRGGRWERVGFRLSGAVTLASGDLDSNLPGGLRLFAAGSVTAQNGEGGQASTSSVAMWDGHQWQCIPNITGTVKTLAVFDDGMGGGPQLYAASNSGLTVNQVWPVDIARWNGHVWQSIYTSYAAGHPTQLGVFDMGQGPHLYVGGVGATGLLRWTGAAWEEAGPPNVQIGIQSMAKLYGPNGPEIVFGGGVTINGQSYSFGRIRADGSVGGISTSLSYFSRFPFVVASITDRLGPAVYLGGGSPTTLGVPVASCYRYDGNEVTPVAATQRFRDVTSDRNDQSTITSFAMFNDGGGPQVFGAGWVSACGDPGAAPTDYAPTGLMFRIPQSGSDAGHVLPVGNGVASSGSQIYRISSRVIRYAGRDQLAIAGPVLSAGKSATWGIALFDGTTWTPFVPPVGIIGSFNPSVVAALTIGGVERLVFNWSPRTSGGIGYFPGTTLSFSVVPGTSNGLNYRNIVLFDDGTTDGPVLYTQDSQYIRRAVNGQSQTIFGGPEVQSMIVGDLGSGPRLFIGARFADGPGVAVWNGAGWDRIGAADQFVSVPTALTVHDDGDGPRLYCSFESVAMFDGRVTPRIAKWGGQHWEPLGDGLRSGGSVLRLALASFDDGTGPALYAAGDFLIAGRLPSRGFARWRNGRWEPYLDINQRVFEGQPLAELNLSVLGDTLYLIGYFADTGLRPAGAPTNTEANVIQAQNILAIRACPPACFPDLNHDGNVDAGDIDFLINVAAGGDNPAGVVTDLNRDGVTDTGDVDLLINVVAGGNCNT